MRPVSELSHLFCHRDMTYFFYAILTSAMDVDFLSSVKVSASFAASFARWSAISLPAIALWPGVQSICVGTSFCLRMLKPFYVTDNIFVAGVFPS